ncbi:MAG: CcoQ/FixQ family Cbb3-type cytochrome c oxidase assembly chaperone [Bacteroidota bacterium]|nr:CcoQ/FixQ family Cbb3-type cytochrome c oxidase assembly chaperone [Bacteroidota bacterium]
MKFIHYLEKITGVDIYALTSLTIFLSFFIIMLLWAWKADKNMINEISQIPLDN